MNTFNKNHNPTVVLVILLTFTALVGLAVLSPPTAVIAAPAPQTALFPPAAAAGSFAPQLFFNEPVTDTLTPDFLFTGQNCPDCLGADIKISKSDGTTLSPKGSVLAYTLTYENAGADIATGVTITEVVPANTTFAPSLSSNGWQQLGSTTIYRYDVGTLAKGASGSVIFAVNMDDTLPPGVETITNTVTIADDGQHGIDKNPEDNTDTDVNFITNEPTSVCGTITSNTTWSPFGSPYIVTCDIVIPAGVTLNLIQGTVVQFASNTGIRVNGTLNAQGTPATNVIFTANTSNPTRGYWDGIDIFSGGSAVIDHAEILYGGSTTDNYDAALYNLTGGSLTLTNSHISASNSWAAVVGQSTGTITQFNNIIGTDNAIQGIWVDGTTDQTITWGSTIPLVVNQVNINSPGDLTISPDSIIKFYNEGSYLHVRGSLNAIGTAADPITFTTYRDDIGGDTNNSTAGPYRGAWNTITILDGGTATIDYATIRYGGDTNANDYDALIYVSGNSSLNLAHSTLYESESRGVYSPGGSIDIEGNTIRHNNWRGLQLNINANTPPPRVVGNTIRNNSEYAMSVVYNSTFVGEFRDNTGTGNNVNGIKIDGTISGGEARWYTNNNFPYVLDELTVAADATLSLDPGVIVKFNDEASDLALYGTLDARGTIDNQIIFTTLRDDLFGGDTNNSTAGPYRGAWNTIEVFTGATAVMDHTLVRYGGDTNANDYDTLLYVQTGGDLTLTNSTLHDSESRGIYSPGGTINLENNTIRHNNWRGLQLTVSADTPSPRVVDNIIHNHSGEYAMSVVYNDAFVGEFRGNSGYSNNVNGIKIDGTIVGHTRWYTNTDFPYVIDELTIAADSSLTPDPGTIIKFNDEASDLAVFGLLDIHGTAANPIVFTTLRDDSYGGDTNNSTAGPYRGAWNTIEIFAGATAVIDHAIIRYGGDTNDNLYDTLLYVPPGGSLTLTNSTLHDSESRGIYSPGGTIDIENNTIRHNNWRGLQLNVNADTPTPRVVNNTIRNHSGEYAMSVVYNNASAGDFSGNTGTGNNRNGIKIDGTIVGHTRWLTNTNFPYIIDELTVAVSSTLDPDPGVIIKFNDEASDLAVYGTLDARGTAANQIVFTTLRDDVFGGDTNSSTAGPYRGAWNTIELFSGATGIFDYTLVRYGGDTNDNNYDALVYVANGAVLTATNATFNDSEHFGISSVGGAVNLENNTIRHNSYRALRLHINADTPPPRIINNAFNHSGSVAVAIYYNNAFAGEFRDNSGTGNFRNAFFIEGTIANGTAHWHTNNNFPYLVYSGVSVAATGVLRLDPGVIVKLDNEGTSLPIYGLLDAQGVPGNEIVFTTLRDDAYGGDTNSSTAGPYRGAWNTIEILNGATAVLDHTLIRYGGDSNSNIHDSLVYIESGGVLTLTHSTLTESETDAVWNNGGTLTLQDNTLRYNSSRGLRLVLNGTTPPPIVRDNFMANNGFYPSTIQYNNADAVVFVNNTGHSNGTDGIQVNGVISGTTAVWRHNPDLPYVINAFSIGAAGALTIQPDVVAKFPGESSHLAINGALLVNGTPGHEVVFTTIRDDAYGGDTNNSTAGPYRGAWNTIEVFDTATATINHAIIRYGGDTNSNDYDALLYLSANGALTLTNSILTLSEHFGLRVHGSSHTLTGNDIYNNNSHGLFNGDTANITVDARDNWWGHPSGPAHATNPGGTGESVNDNVLFDPWRTVNANFTVDTTSGTAPLATAFTDASAGTPTSWLWDFGDGITSTLQNPAHMFTTPGTYTVTLTVADTTTTDTLVRPAYITVNAPLSASPAAENTAVTRLLEQQQMKDRRLFSTRSLLQTPVITQTFPPPLPSSFYGYVSVEGDNVPEGLLVTAAINGVQFAESPIFLENGRSAYHIDVPGDITDTLTIEGGVDNDLITFRIGGAIADQTASWQFGTYEPLDLTTFYGVDLVVTHAPVAATVLPGEPITYTVTITNNGPENAPGTQITNQLSPYATLLSATDEGIEADGTVTWPAISLAVGQTVQRSFVVQVHDTFPSGAHTIENATSATYDGTNGLDSAPANNTATAVSQLDAAPDLQISKQADPTPVVPGSPFHYTLTITNTGVQEASGVIITDALPPYLTFLNASHSGLEEDGTPGFIKWPPIYVTAGQVVSRVITVRLAQLPVLPPTATHLTNTVSVSDDGINGPEPNTADNAFTLVTPILTQPDLIVSGMALDAATTDSTSLTLSGSITASLQNAGNLAVTAPFQVTLFADGDDDALFTPGVDTILGQSISGSTLGISQTVALAVPVSGTVQFRDDHVHAFVDSLEEIAELYETNNYYNSANSCEYVPIPEDFNPQVELSWPRPGTVEPGSIDTISTPLVVNLNDDNGDGSINEADVPDILFVTADLSGVSYTPPPVMLRAIDGQTGQAILNVPQFYVIGLTSIFLYAASGMAVGDIDNDGLPEIVTSAIVVNIHPLAFGVSNRLVAFNHDGSRKWYSPVYTTHPNGSLTNRDNPTIADLDGDGTPEIIVGANVFNNNGSLRWKGTAGQAYQSARNQNRADSGAIPVVADLDMDGTQELLAGNTAYRADGTIYWQAPYDDGYPAVANFDADDYPEIVVVARGRIRLQEHDGTLIWGPHDLPSTTAVAGGAPTIADFDGDGQPEIGVAGADRYVVFETDGSLKWQTTTQDHSSNMTGSTVFDLDGNGQYEVIYRDERRLRIYRGLDGVVLFDYPLSSETQTEMVVVADVDADGNAEIVVTSDRARQVPNIPGGERSFGIRVFGDANDNWVATRSIWNQHAYSIDNVNDDSTIPLQPTYSWLTHNTFRANTGGAVGQASLFAAPDLSLSITDVDLLAHPDVVITARVGNGGAAFAPAGTSVALYDGDPQAGGSLISTATLPTPLQPGEFVDLTFDWTMPGFAAGSLFAAVDDDGTGQGRHGECREDNNQDRYDYDTAVLGIITNKDDGRIQVASGETVTYTITIGNAFNNPATGIVVTDTLPQYTTFVAASQGVTTTTDTVVWPAFSLNPGETATRTVTVQIDATLPLTATAITNTVTATDDGTNGPDETPANNTATDVDALSTVRADAGGPYSGDEGETILLDASGSFDRDGTIILYEWDLDDDGDYDDAVGITATAVFPDDDTFTIGLRVTDNDDETDTDAALITTHNISPTVTAATDPIFNEGISAVAALATFVDVGSADTHTATVEWGDGTVVTTALTSGEIEIAHTYVDDGLYPIEVCVTDDDGATGCATLQAIVSNLAAAVEAGPDIAAEAGETVSLAPATFSDSGVNDTHVATVDWGDGTTITATVTESGGTGVVDAAHVYAVKSVYPVEVCVIDNGGAVGCDTFIVNLVDVAVSKDNGTTAVRPGDTVTYTVTISNVGTIDLTGIVVTDTLPGYVTFIATSHNGNYNAVDERITWFIPTLTVGQSVSRTVTLQADGTPPPAVGIITNTVTVLDDGSNGPDMHPENNSFQDVDTLLSVTAQAGGPYNGSEGEPITLDASATTDRNGVIVLYEWDLDEDGLFDDALGITPTVIFADNGLFTIRVRATDDSGESDIATTTAEILNLTPIVQAFVPITITEGDTVSQLIATFADMGSSDTHTATINWLDGTIEPGIVTEASGSGSVFGVHRYLDDGSFPVEVCVEDSDGAAACDTFTVVVLNSLPFLDSTRLTDLRLWHDDGLISCFDPTANWYISADGSVVTQTLNSRPSVFYGNFSPFDTRVEGSVSVLTRTVTNTVPFIDDDYFGFTLGYHPDDLNNPDADYLLVDWKGGSVQGNNFGCGGYTEAQPGLAVSRVTGSPADAEMWGHTNYSCNGDEAGVQELGRALNLGQTGWAFDTEYTMAFELSATRLQVYVNGSLEIDITGDFAHLANGRFGFYTYSQPDVAFRNFEFQSITVDEGSTLNLDTDFSDLGILDTHTAVIDWGDGTIVSGTVTEDNGSGTVVSAYTYPDGDASYVMELCLTDDDGGTKCHDIDVTVRNVAPTVEAGPDIAANAGEVISLTQTTFTDPGLLDTHTAVVNWGDGTLVTGTITQSNGLNIVQASHTYAANSVYTTEVCVTDKDGATSCDTFQVNSVDLSVTKNDGQVVAVPGQVLTYSLVIENLGTLTTTNINVGDILPHYTTFLNASHSGTYDTNAHLVLWTIPSLAAGGVTSRTVTVQVNGLLPAPVDVITNTVLVSDDASHGPEQTAANNIATDVNLIPDPPLANFSTAKALNAIQLEDGAAVLGASSSWSSTYPPPNAIDSSGSTAWRTANGQVSDQALTVTAIGSGAQVIDAVTIQSAADTSSVKTFEIRVSTLNTATLTTVLSATLPQDGAAHTFHFDPVQARYIQLFIYDNWGHTDYIEVVDFAAHTRERQGGVVSLLEGTAVIADTTGAHASQPATQAIDFDGESYWQTADGGITAQWIKVDLIGDEAHLIDRVQIKSVAGTASVQDFQIRVSTTGLDDDDFDTILFGTIPSDGRSHWVTFPPAAAKYVQFYIVNNYGHMSYIQLKDFQVYSSQIGGATVPFDDFSRGTSAQVQGWQWDFGDGTTSSEQHPLHTYAAPGTYSVTLVITDGYGLTDSAAMAYTVLPPPTVDFTWAPLVPDENQTVNFTDLSTAPVGSVLVDWQWTLTDPAAQVDGTAATQTFLDSGPHPVRLTVTNSELVTATQVYTVMVRNITPTVSLSPDSIIRRTGDPVQIPGGETAVSIADPSPTDFANLTYHWDLGDGRVVTMTNNVNFTYPLPGTYTITLTVTDPDGATASDSLQVIVFDDHIPPVPVIDLIGSKNMALLQNQNIPSLLGAGATIVDYSSRYNNGTLDITNLLDLSTDSDWATASGRPLPQSVTIRLAGGELYTIDRVQVQARTDCCADQGVQEFEVWVSTTTSDEWAFTKVLDTTAANHANLQEFVLPGGPVEARYVRYVPRTNYGNSCCVTTARFNVVAVDNLKPGGVIAASSQLDNAHSAEMILDNTTDTYWQTTSGSNEAVTILLADGEIHPIHGVSIYPRAVSNQGLQDFAIQVSTTTADPAAFTTVYTGTAQNSSQMQHFFFPADVDAKYVRLLALNNYGSSCCISLYQFEVRATTPREVDNWFNSEVLVRLSTDENPGGSGTTQIEYSTNSGSSWTTFNQSFLFSTHGSTPFSVRAEDLAGNQSAPTHTFIPIDESPKLTSQETGQKGVDWLTTAVQDKSNSLNCVACHVQGDVLHGLALGGSTGFTLDTSDTTGIDWLVEFITDPAYHNQSNGLWGHPPGGSSYRTINTSHSLFGLAMYDRFISTSKTDSLLLGVNAMLGRQQSNGRWALDHFSPPTNQGDIEPTMHMLFALNQAKTRVDPATAAQYQASIDSAVAWLQAATPSGTYNQDKALKLIGLIEAGFATDDPLVVDLINTILTDQFIDGGWAERTTYNWTSSFATGQAVYALCVAGVSRTHPQVIEGIDWLIHHQISHAPNSGGLVNRGELDGPWALRYTGTGVPFSSTMWPVIALGCYGDLSFELDIAPPTRVLEPAQPISQTVTYTVTLLNSGVATDTYDLAVTGGLPGWQIALNTDMVTVGIDATTNLTLTVTAPPGLPEGLSVLLGVTANSQTNPTVVRSVQVEALTTAPPTVGHNTATTIVDGDGVVTSISTPTRLAATVQDTTDAVPVIGPNAGVVNFLVAGIPVGSDADTDGDGVFEIIWTPGPNWPSIGTQDLRAIYSGIDRPDPGIDLLPSFDAGSLTVSDAVDVAVSKDNGVSVVKPDEVVTYTIAVRNEGTLPVTGITITDVVPAYTTIITASDSAAIAGDTVVWTIPGLAPGAAVNRTLIVQVDATIPVTITAISNGVTAADDGINGVDVVPANNTDTDVDIVSIVNLDPTAVDDTATTTEATAVLIDVLANDSDPDGDVLTVVSVTQPLSGTVVVNVDDTVTYTPTGTFNGDDAFTYTISDGNGGSATAAVTVTVTPLNDAPTAVDDGVTTPEDTAVLIDVLANDTDPDSDPLTIIDMTPAANGLVEINPDDTITYTPLANFNGADAFTYTISDGNGGVDTATVTVTVTPVNDPPTAVDDAALLPEDTAVTINVLANDSDIENDSLSVTAVTPPTNGIAVINPDQTVTYTPTANFYGSDSFLYTVSDGNGGVDTAVVDLVVTPVNDAPEAVDDTATTPEDTAVTIAILANDFDVDLDALTLLTVTLPAHGAVAVNPDSTLTYTPTANFNGGDSLTYTISDGNGGVATAAVAITVTPVNDVPVAVDDVATTPEETAVVIDLLLNDTDIDLDPLTVVSTTQPANGVVVIEVDNTVTYTPVVDFNGSDTFDYTIADGHGGTASATVTVTVTPVNDEPVAVDDTATTAIDTAVIIPVLANDSDADNDPLTVVTITLPLSGTAVINPDNTITYTPTASFIGEDAFTYTIEDGSGGSAVAQVTVTVTPPSWEEVCQPDSNRIEIIGTGMGHAGATTQNPAMLTIPDPGTVDFILAQVVLNNYTGTLPDKVIISSENETHELLAPSSSSGGFNYEVYLQPANQITAEVVGDGNPGDKTPRALILYLFRHDTGTIANSGRLVHEYVFEASHTQLLTIPTSTFARDVVVTFAVSDVDDDDRLLTLTAGAGSTSQSVDIIQPNRGDELLLYDVILPAVPGEVDTITTTLTSPSGGDSLYWSGINARVPCAEPVTGDRVTEGLQVLYTFQEGSGSTVHDVSGVGDAFDLVVDNPAAVTWLPDGGLSIDTPTVIQSLGAATKVVNTAQATNELTIEAWVKPANVTQDGPARIVTLSPDGASHNFTIGQGQWAGLPADTFVGRLATSEAQSELIPPAGTASTDLTHLVYTRDGAGVVRLYVDGVEVAADVAGGDLSSWDVGYPLSLGNEPTGDRPWRGQFHLVAFYNQALNVAEVQQNFAAGSGTTPPPPLPPGTRVTQNLQALYTFQEGSGTTVADVSGVGSPLNLTISDETAVTWLTGGGLRTDSSVVISSGGAASKVINPAQATDEVSVEMWVKPNDINQDGPARIVTISPDGTANNLTIGQGQWASLPKDVYIGRLRTDETQIQVNSPSGTASADLTHVVFTRNAEGEIHIYVDGVAVMAATAAGDFSSWDLNYPLTLANEPTGDRPWRGELHLVAFYNRALSPEDVTQNFTAGSSFVAGERVEEEAAGEDISLEDASIHGSGYVPTALLSRAPLVYDYLAL